MRPKKSLHVWHCCPFAFPVRLTLLWRCCMQSVRFVHVTQTLFDILTKEFVNEYSAIRYGETDKVIEYFKSELQRIGKEDTRITCRITYFNQIAGTFTRYSDCSEIIIRVIGQIKNL